MTTIACDGKTMVGDGLAIVGHSAIHSRIEVKLFVFKGTVYGVSGTSAGRHKFRQWLEGGKVDSKPDYDSKEHGFCALSLDPDGQIFYWDEHFVPLPSDAPQAIGSGCEFAHGAMLAGKTAREAVEIAGIADAFTGGKITELAPMPAKASEKRALRKAKRKWGKKVAK